MNKTPVKQLKTPNIIIRKVIDSDRVWIKEFATREWAGDKIVSKGKIHYASKCSGFIALEKSKPVGLTTFIIENNALEIITLNAIKKGQGIGTKLLNRLMGYAKEKNIKRIWCITTNDNLPALSFYKKRGLRIFKVYPNAVEKSRQIKPEIPLVGYNNIPIRDEIELEYLISENLS